MNFPSLVISAIVSKVPFNVACTLGQLNSAWADEVFHRYPQTYRKWKVEEDWRYFIQKKRRRIITIFDGELTFVKTVVGVGANFLWRVVAPKREGTKAYYIRDYVMDHLLKTMDINRGKMFGTWIEIEFAKDKHFLFPFNLKHLLVQNGKSSTPVTRLNLLVE